MTESASSSFLPANRREEQAHRSYQEWFLQLTKSRHIDYPMDVSIETLAQCNAGCAFCPYPTLQRKGDRMSDALVHKIIDELTAIPRDLPLGINLSRVNEPFLDVRLLDFVLRINQQLPQAQLTFFTNGSPLTPSLQQRLATVEHVKYLCVSFNDHRAAEYERVMKLPYPRTVDHLEHLHGMLERGVISFPISISRVGDGSGADEEFLQWVKARWPRFNPLVSPRSDWMGLVSSSTRESIPAVGCYQWFKLHILASGKEAYCCIDAEGRFGRGDALTTNILDIYNHPDRRRLRVEGPMRQQVANCRACPLLS